MTHSAIADIAEEVATARADVALLDLSDRGKLRVTGSERATWLHGMVSNDVVGLKTGEGNYGTVLTDRGKMLGDYRLIVRDDFLLLDTEAVVKSSLRERLDRFIISEDAEIREEHGEWTMIGVVGPKARATLSAALDAEIPDLPEYGSAAVEVGGAAVIVARQNRTGALGYDVWTPANQVNGARDRLAAMDAPLLSADALETLRIEAGIARYGADTDDNIIPLEARLDHAIHWEKGCYVGQEIVARMHYRGHPNKLLVGLKFEGDRLPEVGTDLYRDAGDAKRSGWITSATRSPTVNAVVGLGYVRAKMADAGTPYVIPGDKPQRVEVAETPFV